MSITYSERVSVALGTQLATRMRLIIIFGLSAVTHFFTLTYTHQDLGETLLYIHVKWV
jgi:hypothetical protein